jgi:hypothetical protein
VIVSTGSAHRASALLAIVLLSICAGGCKTNDSDSRQQEDQERIMAEGVARAGMPAIRNFHEKRQPKDLLEMRDQANLSTVTFLVAEQTAELVFLCDSIGYGIPAATQYTNPMKVGTHAGGVYVIPQADPNGLFSPASAEGTWVTCRDPNGKATAPVYVEPRVVVSQFDLRRRSRAPAAEADPHRDPEDDPSARRASDNSNKKVTR